MLKMYDFHCVNCETFFEALVDSQKNTVNYACTCGTLADRIVGGGHSFTTIVPAYPGSKKRKAGYQHSHADRPKTPGKIQVGYTGK